MKYSKNRPGDVHSNAITLTCSFYDGRILFDGLVRITAAL